MEELTIQSHSFEEAKNQLKKFSEEAPKDVKLSGVDSDKGFGEFLGDLLFGRGIGLTHKVTGAEFNQLTVQVQNHLIELNNMQKEFIGEIGQVYAALEALDKDYIQAILIAVKSAQKANGEAKTAQKDIEKTIAEQKKIIKVLQQFKEKLDGYKHVADIDKMWENIEARKKEILETKKNVEEVETCICEVSEIIDKLLGKVEEQSKLCSSLKNSIDKIVAQKHVYEVDDIWQDIQNVGEKVSTFSEEIQKLKDFLEEKSLFIDRLVKRIEQIESIEHLSDVDDMYADIGELKGAIGQLMEEQSEMEKRNMELARSVEEECSKRVKTENELGERIRKAYFLAGGAIGIAIIELIIMIVRLI